jgi:hypothetical protein
VSGQLRPYPPALIPVAVELPLNIHNDNATYETQFGFVQRPTHKNTTLDMAKFEVCGHKVHQQGFTPSPMSNE